jgi:hypothetical protein
MNKFDKLALYTGVAIVAMAVAGPGFAGQGVLGGDDSATIVQVGEVGGTASQHQPGLNGNVALITQTTGNGDIATQEQWRNLNGVDFAINSHQTITQTSNLRARASQQDNGLGGSGGDVQTITQIGNVPVGATSTSANQSINDPFGNGNRQTSTQTANAGSSVNQLIGQTAPGNLVGNLNTQTATQTGQVSSTIDQQISLATASSNSNTQTASEIGGGVSNLITQLQNSGSVSNSQEASVNIGSLNTIHQTQDVASHNNFQTADILAGSGNFVEQIQSANTSGDRQTVAITLSNNGRALQFQSPGITGGLQTIVQNGGGNNNQAGQAQGNSLNVASITQTGGSSNIALQNQGLLPGASGFMHVVGTTVTRTP